MWNMQGMGNSFRYPCAKNYQHITWFDRVIEKIKGCSFCLTGYECQWCWFSFCLVTYCNFCCMWRYLTSSWTTNTPLLNGLTYLLQLDLALHTMKLYHFLSVKDGFMWLKNHQHSTALYISSLLRSAIWLSHGNNCVQCGRHVSLWWIWVLWPLSVR